MEIALRVHPGETVEFDVFCEATPGPAVALDGYVAGPSAWSWNGPHGNFNHHEDVNRLGTRATCEQVLFAERGGLWDAFSGHDILEVHVNDCDADVCLSVWLLENPERAQERDVELLVSLEGSLDCTGGCVAGGADEALLDKIAWVFEPYNVWRTTSGHTDADTQAAIIRAVGERITAWADGIAGSTSSTSDFEILERRGPVCAVVEYGPLARLRMHTAGIDVFVSVRDQGGVRVVSIGKASPFVPFDLCAVYDELNDLEGIAPSERRCSGWGGSDTIGGSPRAEGTDLPVGVILDAVTHHRYC